MNSAFITSYERDNETDLDFAEARMYNVQHGRFTTTDPVLMEPNRAIDPQRLNLYGYVRNNPLILVDSTGQIIDDSNGEDNKKYQEWKNAFLATKKGRDLWDKYHNDPNFMLIINIDPNRKNGAKTHSLKFKDGMLSGAIITLGNDIGDRAAAAKRNPDQYPLQQAMGEKGVDSNILAAGVIAHEFGHVEDAKNRPKLWQALQEYSILKEQRDKLNGVQATFTDPDVLRKQQAAVNASGLSNFDEVILDQDNRAERVAIPVIQQSFANKRKNVHPKIQNAIDKLSGNKK